MPNHVHGILLFHDAEPAPHDGPAYEQFSRPVAGSLSTAMRSYKGSVTRWARANGHPDFRWLGRFYEHIVRSEAALLRIRRYVEDNPLRWHLDRENPDAR